MTMPVYSFSLPQFFNWKEPKANKIYSELILTILGIKCYMPLIVHKNQNTL